MKKYNFKLRTVLSLREGIEKEWEAKLGKANGECQVIINRIDQFKEKIKVSKATDVDITQYHSKCLYEERLNYQISIEQKLLKEKEAERDRVKKIYLEKSRDRKVIDKLKDKSVKQYHKDSLKEETLIIDEINSSSQIRNKMLGGIS